MADSIIFCETASALTGPSLFEPARPTPLSDPESDPDCPILLSDPSRPVRFLTRKEVSEQMHSEGLLHPSISALKYAKSRKKRKKRNRVRRKARKDRTLERVHTEWIEPSASTIDYHNSLRTEAGSGWQPLANKRFSDGTFELYPFSIGTAQIVVISPYIPPVHFFRRCLKGLIGNTFNAVVTVATEEHGYPQEIMDRLFQVRAELPIFLVCEEGTELMTHDFKAKGDFAHIEESILAEFVEESIDAEWKSGESDFNNTILETLMMGEDFLATLDNAVDGTGSFASVLCHKVTDICTSIGCYAFQLYKSSSFADYMVATVQFVKSLGLEVAPYMWKIKEFVLKNFRHLRYWVSNLQKRLFQTESLSDYSNVFSSIMHSTLAVSLRSFILSVVSMKWFSRDVTHALKWAAGFANKTSLANIVPQLLEGIRVLTRFSSRLIAGESLSDLWFENDPHQITIDRTLELLTYSDEERIIMGLPKPFHMDRKDFVRNAIECVSDLRSLIKETSPFYTQFSFMEDLLVRIGVACEAHKTILRAHSRHAPMAIILHGDPGVGKSHILPLIYKIWSKVKDRIFMPHQVFCRTKTSQYLEGYEPFGQPIMYYSELGNISAAQAKRGAGLEMLSEIQSLIDSNPMALDMAFADKGKMFAMPELIAVDTNNPGLHLDEMMFCPSAMERRFLYVQVEVQPQFRKTGSTAIDPHKCFDADGLALDRYDWVIYHYTPVGRKSQMKTLLRTSDVVEFSKALFALFTEHVRMAEVNDNTDFHSDILDSLSFAETTYGREKFDAVCKELLETVHVGETDETTDFLNWVKHSAEDVVTYDVSDQPVGFVEKTFEGRVGIPMPADYDPYDMEEKDDLKTESLRDYVPDGVKTAFQKWRDSRGIVSKVKTKFRAMQTWSCRVVSDISIVIMFLISADFLSVYDTGYHNCMVFSMYRFFAFALCIRFYSYSVALLFLMDLKLLAKNLTTYISQHARAIQEERYQSAKRRLLAHVTNKVYNPFQNASWPMMIVPFAAIVLAVRIYMKNSVSTEAEVSKEVRPVVALRKYEKELECDRSRVRVKTVFQESWNTVHTSISLPLHKGPSRELYPAIACNIRYVGVVFEKVIFTHIFGIGGTFFLINAHAVRSRKEFDLLYFPGHSSDGKSVKISIQPSRVVEVTRDLYLIDIATSRSRDVVKHFMVEKYQGTTTGVALNNDVRLKYVTETPIIEDSFQGPLPNGDAYHYMLPWRKAMCGTPLVADMGNGSSIVGIHFAGSSSSNDRFAIPVTQGMLVEARDALRMASPTLYINPMNTVTESLELPSQKSVFRYEPMVSLEYYGKTGGYVMMNSKSSLVPSLYSSQMKSMFLEVLGFENQEFYGPPPMKPFHRDGEYISPFNVGMRKMNNTPPSLDDRILRIVIARFVDKIDNELPVEEQWKPFDVQTAVNGDADDDFFRRINCATGGGHGYVQGKDFYIPVYDDEKCIRKPIDSLEDRLSNIIQVYLDGGSMNFIYKVQLKDEARLISKVLAGKTRLFYMISLDNLIISRMMLGPFFSSMVAHSDVYCTAVGIDMHRGSDRLVRRFADFSPYMLEGDYSGYDVANPLEIGQASATVIIEVCRRRGFNEHAIKVLSGLLSDGLYPMLLLNGDLFSKAGMQPSGKYGTAEENSLRGVIMLMYAWYATPQLAERDFFAYVLPCVYGDDLLASVKGDVIGLFNNVTYQEMCKRFYNMDFTSASKSMDIEEYVTIDTMSFLKRKFVQNDAGIYEGLLSMESIYKALQWTIPSSNISQEDQLVASCQSSMWEFYFHLDANTYRTLRDHIIRILSETFSGTIDEYEILIPVYESIHERIYGTTEDRLTTEAGRASSRVLDVVPVGGLFSLFSNVCAHTNIIGKHYTTASFIPGTEDRRIIQWCTTRIINQKRLDDKDLTHLLSAINGEIARIEHEFKICSIGEEKFMPDEDSLWAFHLGYDGTGSLHVYLEQLVMTRRVLRRRKFAQEVRDCRTESGDMASGAVSMEGKYDEENVSDMAGSMVDESSAGIQFLLPNGQHTTFDLDNFFARPIEIDTGTFTLGTDNTRILNVWSLFSQNPTVRAKLRNYAYFKATLHVRVIFSGSPFHYGRILVSYQPYSSGNANLENYFTFLSIYPLARAMRNNYLSQAPGARYIDPKANQPVDMEIPFISTKPAHRLFNSNGLVITDLTNYEDLENAGSLYITTINPIRAVSDAPSEVSYQVFAWATDVNLGVPTATVVSIQTESGDERKTGPVERWSTRLVSVSDALRKVPTIGPFATASSYVLRGVGALASHMGWSRPVANSEPQYMVPRPLQNGCHVIQTDTSKRITLDPMQELSVDPRVVAIDEDDMVMGVIAARESYFQTFTWDPTDLIMSDPIFLCRVHPQLDTVYETPTKTFHQPTALSFVATPFSYWHGAIEFRIEVVASQYHRGKLLVFYEPNIAQATMINSDLSLNKNCIGIIDLQETQCVSYCVEWAHPRAWASLLDSSESVFNYSAFSTISNSYEYVNGYIGIVPFTEIQSPDGSGVEVNVYVRGKDMQFNYLTASNLPVERLVTESYSPMSENKAPEECTCTVLNPTSADPSWISQMHFGEQPLSFRALMKRFVTVDRQTIPAGTASDVSVEVIGRVIPPINPSYGGSSGVVTRNLFSYLRYGYLGLRGGIKHRLHIVGPAISDACLNATVSLANIGTSNSTSVAWSTEPCTTALNGSVSYVTMTNGGVDVEIPMYTSNLFLFSFSDDLIVATYPNEMSFSWMKRFLYKTEVSDATVAALWYVDNISVAEDFSLMRYQGAPWFSNDPIVQ